METFVHERRAIGRSKIFTLRKVYAFEPVLIASAAMVLYDVRIPPTAIWRVVNALLVLGKTAEGALRGVVSHVVGLFCHALISPHGLDEAAVVVNDVVVASLPVAQVDGVFDVFGALYCSDSFASHGRLKILFWCCNVLFYL